MIRTTNPIPPLRIAGLAEAVSFLVLLGVAMPLKYFAGFPAAVKVAGWIHGLLFILFCAALLRAALVAKWPPSRTALVFAAALLPFGPVRDGPADEAVRTGVSENTDAPIGS